MSMKLPLYQVDAFTGRVFAGNPAAVCPLDDWLPAETMQAVAAENNLSETAFFIERGDHYDLRWFTPALEVDLCGHATLASAYVIFHVLGSDQRSLRFETRSGALTVERRNGLLVMDFPAQPPGPCAAPEGLPEALGVEPREVLAVTRDYFVVLGSEDEVRGLAPDMAAIAALDRLGVVVSAPGAQADFVSRFFAPRAGIPEDPVTGSTHCALTPYWAERLGKGKLKALQLSPRGGELDCEALGERVRIAGHCALYLEGAIHV